MSTPELGALLEQYRAGLESELILLVHVQEIAARQHEMTQSADINALQRAIDRRDALTADLIKLEDQMRPLRDRLTRDRAAHHLPGFTHAVALYQTIARLVAEVLETDGHSVRTLAQIVSARRAAAQEAEQAEATLAAYGRAAAVRPRTATLVNRRG